MENDSEFKEWLVNRKSLSRKVANDNVSRINRLMRLIPVSSDESIVDVRYHLEKTKEYASLSASVRSQLKRSAVLYLEWRNEQG